MISYLKMSEFRWETLKISSFSQLSASKMSESLGDWKRTSRNSKSLGEEASKASNKYMTLAFITFIANKINGNSNHPLKWLPFRGWTLFPNVL
jgi:hypothetical protein